MWLCKLNKVFANWNSSMPKVSMFLLKHEDEEAKMPFNVASYKGNETWNISSFGKTKVVFFIWLKTFKSECPCPLAITPQIKLEHASWFFFSFPFL